MKKRIFFQLHPLWVFINLFLLFSICVMPYLIVSNIKKLYNTESGSFNSIVETIVILCLGYPLIVWLFFAYARHRIVFHKEHIYVPYEWKIKQYRIQHEVNVKYEDIEKIVFIKSTKSSRNQTVKGTGITPYYYHFMELTLKDGSQQRIFVSSFLTRQKQKMIHELETRLQTIGNPIDFSETRQSLKNLGYFGPKWAVDFEEKKRIKKQAKKLEKEEKENNK